MQSESPELVFEILRRACIARTAEEALNEVLEKVKAPKMVHLSIGEELLASAVAVLKPSDAKVFTHHRSHAFAYALYPEEAVELACEFLGRKEGVFQGYCGGMLLDLPYLSSDGILGGALGRALGYALAGGKAVVFVGEGTVSEGVFHEVLNIAGIYKPWFVVIVSWNMAVVESPAPTYLAVDLRKFAEAYGFRYYEVNGWDVYDVVRVLAEAFTVAENVPVLIKAHLPRGTQHYGAGRDMYVPDAVKVYFEIPWVVNPCLAVPFSPTDYEVIRSGIRRCAGLE